MKCYMTGKQCDSFKEIPPISKGIFIVSPFGFPYDAIYADKGHVSNALIEKGFDPLRSDSTMRLGSVMCQGICREIIDRAYLLADLSQPNPNVYYELGLACALGRKIVVCQNPAAGNPYLAFGTEIGAIDYPDVDELPGLLAEAFSEPAVLFDGGDSETNHTLKDPQALPKLLVLENPQSGVVGLHEKIIGNALKDMNFGRLAQKQEEDFVEKFWRNWDVEHRCILGLADEKSTVQQLFNAIDTSEVCVIDTTPYSNQLGCSNPCMYFWLGVAHGREKEAIPVTSTRNTAVTPFDVKGLWHIFHAHGSELKQGFEKIMPRICRDAHMRRKEAPYRRVWDCFLRNKESMSIIYCGRSTAGAGAEGEEPTRGPRTNIDSWDSKAVYEASFYLGQRYPTVSIRPASPKAKILVGDAGEEAVRARMARYTAIKEELENEHRNCIIVGSPDVSDYAEIMLAEIFGLEAFEPAENAANPDSFIFLKDNIDTRVRSAFYCPHNTKQVEFPGVGTVEVHASNERTCGCTYGVLVIGRNPLTKTKIEADAKKQAGREQPPPEKYDWVMVLSGFTGLATCGLMQLVIDSDSVDGDEQVKHFRRTFLEEIAQKFYPKREEPFLALVRFDFSERRHEGEGDRRYITGLKVMDAAHQE